MDRDGKNPVYSSISDNNGIMGYTKMTPTYRVNEEIPFYIVFGDHTRSFNIANTDFCVMDNVKVLKPLRVHTLKQLIFVISSWKNGVVDKGYSRHWSIAKEVGIQLPIKNGKIDFEFMDAYISELAAYLKVSGLDNYELSSDEKQALENMRLIQWEEKDITGTSGVFNVKNTKSILSSKVIPNSGKTPYLCAGAENNSVSNYIAYKEALKDKGNCIFIGGKTFVVSYQESDFFSNDRHNLALYLKDKDKADKINQLFLATCIRKGLRHKYSWGDSISRQKIQKDKLMLPIKNNEIDFSYMNTLISAVQKLVIKDVVLWADKKIYATKKVINKN